METEENTSVADEEEVAQPVPVTEEINETIVDEELGYTITVKQAMFNIPFDDDKLDIWYNGYRTGICVEVELKNESEYTGTLSIDSLSWVVNDQAKMANNATIQTFQTFADENGLTAFEVYSGPTSGETMTGWLFYYYETGDGDNDLALRYTREETDIVTLGGDGGTTTLPEMEIDVPLPY